MREKVLQIMNPCESRGIFRIGIKSFKSLFFLLCMLLSLVPGARAQKQIESRQQTWIGYFNQSRISKRSGIWLDLHYRLTDDFIRQKTMALARVGYIYYLDDQVRLMAGYTYANRYNQSGVDRIPEHRPWQQLQWIGKKKNFTLTNALRIEQRFRRNVENGEFSDGYNFNWRLRYNIALTIPLKGKDVLPGTPFLQVSDEIMVNAGKQIVYNYFDQNRAFLGLGYQFTPEFNAHIGYLFIFQHQGIADSFLQIHVIRLNLIHNLDFRHNDGY